MKYKGSFSNGKQAELYRADPGKGRGARLVNL